MHSVLRLLNRDQIHPLLVKSHSLCCLFVLSLPVDNYSKIGSNINQIKDKSGTFDKIIALNNKDTICNVHSATKIDQYLSHFHSWKSANFAILQQFHVFQLIPSWFSIKMSQGLLGFMVSRVVKTTNKNLRTILPLS